MICCDICYESTTCFNKCADKHIVCFACIIKLSKDKQVLSCYCNKQICFCNIKTKNAEESKKALSRYLMFYESKFNETLIDFRGEKISYLYINQKESEILKIRNDIENLIQKYSYRFKYLKEREPDMKLESFEIEHRKTPLNCPVNECSGKIDYNNKCQVCKVIICKKCELPEHENDCEETIVKNIQLMSADKNFCICPRCCNRIKRETGCPNVKCPCGLELNINVVNSNTFLANSIYNTGQRNIGKMTKGDFEDFMKMYIIPIEKSLVKNRHSYYVKFNNNVCKLIRRTKS